MRPRKSVVERVIPGEAGTPRPLIRLRVVGLGVACLFALMVVRLWYLQVLDTAAYAHTVTADQVRDVEIPAPRGLILDRGGQTLVGNTSTEDITLSRLSAQQHPEVVGQLSALLGISSAQIEADLENPQNSLYKPVPILENAPMSAVSAVRENPALYPGVSAVVDTQRVYPLGVTGAQLFGYVGQIQKKLPGYQLGDDIGLTGLESQYESWLRGQSGVQPVEVNAQGQVVGTAGPETQPATGDDLITNVDAGLELTLQNALNQQIASLRGTIDPSTGKVINTAGGAAVALDPQNGAVLAMVSDPTYDPSWWVGGISAGHYAALTSPGADNPLLNRAIDGLYTPGSTFKLATATAALKDGLITPGFVYHDTGEFVIPGCQSGGLGCVPLRDNDGEVGGDITVQQAITISSDTFFYNLGAMFWDARGAYGDDAIQQVANAYGYGEQTGIDLPGETDLARVDSPQVVAKEHAQDPKDYPDGSWYTGNNVEMAFGQGGTVITPLEQATAYATFANGGTRYAPEIAAGAVDPATGKVVRTVAPKVVGHVTLSPEDRAAMLAGFEGVIQSASPQGTGYTAFQGFPLGLFPLAGKSGTASVAGGVPTSWFVAWGPVPDPQYLIAVVIEAGGYGATASAPVVRSGFEYLLAHPESPTKLAAPPPPVPSSSTGSSPATAGFAPTTTLAGGATTTSAPTGALRAARRRVVSPPS